MFSEWFVSWDFTFSTECNHGSTGLNRISLSCFTLIIHHQSGESSLNVHYFTLRQHKQHRLTCSYPIGCLLQKDTNRDMLYLSTYIVCLRHFKAFLHKHWFAFNEGRWTESNTETKKHTLQKERTNRKPHLILWFDIFHMFSFRFVFVFPFPSTILFSVFCFFFFLTLIFVLFCAKFDQWRKPGERGRAKHGEKELERT